MGPGKAGKLNRNSQVSNSEHFFSFEILLAFPYSRGFIPAQMIPGFLHIWNESVLRKGLPSTAGIPHRLHTTLKKGFLPKVRAHPVLDLYRRCLHRAMIQSATTDPDHGQNPDFAFELMFLKGLVKENAANQLQPPSELVLQALYKTMLQSSSSLQTRFSHHW